MKEDRQRVPAEEHDEPQVDDGQPALQPRLRACLARLHSAAVVIADLSRDASERDGGIIARRRGRRGHPVGQIRQWIESVFDTLKGQLSLEHHGAITMPGLITPISERLLALAAGLWHNWNIGDPGRHLIAYDH